MEQFKRLKWSWHKYEEEKEYLPRNINFETINDNDPLSRNLNEIHTCVIPPQNEYRIFKTPNELAANRFNVDSFKQQIELKDPRIQIYSKLESSTDLIQQYSYSSELTHQENFKILSFLKNDTIHNSKLLKNSKLLRKSKQELPILIKEKWQKEAEHFERCAEISYHRHITQFNNLICDKFKDLLIHKWKEQEHKFPQVSYQAITMILRNLGSKLSSTSLDHVQSFPVNFKPEFYRINGDFFPCLKNISAENLKLYMKCNSDIELRDCKLDSKPDILISLDVLTQLFVDETQFNTFFTNASNCSKFIYTETIPPKKVTQSYALEEAVKLMLKFNTEWKNASECIQTSTAEIDKFKLESIEEFMLKTIKSYKKHAGANNETSLWNLKNASQKLSISVFHSNIFFLDDQTKAIYSIKFEYQTSFGAEQMTREELLKEWIQLKFSKDSIILRLRIDVKSLEILSVKKLTVDNIENELKGLYSYDPTEALSMLFNIFNCIHNLPEGSYIIQAQTNQDCNKLLIYKETPVTGKNILNDDEFQITETFTRRWIPIDKLTCTFLHINECIAPCCFSYKSGQRVSYMIQNVKKTIKGATQKAVGKKSPEKSPKMLRKRTRKRKNNVKRKTVEKNLK